MKYIDISRTIGRDTLTYPGDTPVSIEQNQNHGITVSKLHLSSHTGTHLDAPRHFIPEGKSLDQLDISFFFHRAYVLDTSSSDDIPVQRVEKVLTQYPHISALLFKTSNSKKQRLSFEKNFVALDERSAELIARSSIKLIGIDYLSIETFYTETFPVHHALLSREILILEDVDLREVSEGEYDLIVLPIKWHNSDGAPARAVLVER